MAQEFPVAPIDSGDRFAIVVAQWNRGVTERLLEGAVTEFRAAGIADEAVVVARVPGAWELPVAAQRLALSGQYAAVICLGAVIQGETTHDEHINRGVSLALAQIALETERPVLMGVLTCRNMQQALERAGGAVGNKGTECARAAIQMVGLLRSIDSA